MTLPRFAREIERMYASQGRETLTARRSVAKSGVSPGSNIIASARTVIDAYMGPDEVALARQYLANFEDATEVRLASQSNSPVYLFYSPSADDTSFNPADWVGFMDVNDDFVSASSADSSGDLRWFAIRPEHKTIAQADPKHEPRERGLEPVLILLRGAPGPLVLPKFYRAIEEGAEREPLQRATSLTIVRKAQLVPGEFAQETGNIWGTFSAINSEDGYSLSYDSGETRFPDGTESMSRYADVTDAEEMRLLVTVVESGVSGSSIRVESDALGESPEVFIVSAGVFHSEWKPVIASGGALFEWYVDSPSSGTAVIGLCQLQER